MRGITSTQITPNNPHNGKTKLAFEQVNFLLAHKKFAKEIVGEEERERGDMKFYTRACDVIRNHKMTCSLYSWRDFCKRWDYF